MSSRLVKTLDEQEQHDHLQKSVLGNVNSGFDHIRDSILDQLQVKGDNVIVKGEEGDQRLIQKVHAKILDMVRFYKARSGTRKKMKDVMRKAIDFDARDYQVLARDFRVPVEEAKDITQLLKSCFDENGRFIRKNFKANISKFAKFEKRVFSFLWHYLKETLHRDDRVAFLNSLQMLIVEMQQRPKAVKMLVQDFLSDPSQISYSDRNAIMLCNMLLRKYNKEVNLHIEITPEEVLKVRAGLDQDTAQKVAAMIDQNQKPFLDKVRNFQKRITEGLVHGTHDEEKRPLKYLLFLTRELYIFLALVEGGSARMVLRSVVREYANPDSEIYHLKGSRENIRQLIQHLFISIKGMGRVGKTEDLGLFKQIYHSKEGFDKIGAVIRQAGLFSRILMCVKECEAEILNRGR